jgi:hypothetical protein
MDIRLIQNCECQFTPPESFLYRTTGYPGCFLASKLQITNNDMTVSWNETDTDRKNIEDSQASLKSNWETNCVICNQFPIEFGIFCQSDIKGHYDQYGTINNGSAIQSIGCYGWIGCPDDSGMVDIYITEGYNYASGFYNVVISSLNKNEEVIIPRLKNKTSLNLKLLGQEINLPWYNTWSPSWSSSPNWSGYWNTSASMTVDLVDCQPT